MENLKFKVSVIIPTLNEEKYIGECLQAITSVASPLASYEVIVVDNGSTDNTTNIVQQFPVTLLKKPDGFVGAVRNHGVQHSTGDVLCFLDSDCVVREDWLKNGLSLLDERQADAVGGSYITRKHPNWIEKYWVLNGDYKVTDGKHLVGGCIFIRREAFFEAGRFDETLNSGEDYELTEVLRKKGLRVDIDPSINLVHLGNPTTMNAFLKRQIWHSADYITNLPNTLKDKIFVLTLAYLGSFLSSAAPLISNHNRVSLIGFGLFLCCPIVLSVKRVRRSQASYNVRELFLIYLLDHAYLTGRVAGICLSTKNALFSANKKVNRR